MPEVPFTYSGGLCTWANDANSLPMGCEKEVDVIAFNGLKGAKFATFNYLINADLSRRIAINEIVSITCYSYPTIYAAIIKLVEDGFIIRKGFSPGKAYYYEVIDDFSYTSTRIMG